MRTRALPALLLLAASLHTVSPACATVVCLTHSGTLKARVVCKHKETQVGAADLGLQCSCSPAPAMICAFKRTPCTSDADCGIAGLCAVEGDCRHACSAGCPDSTFCFNAAGVGSICVGCGGDDSRCTGEETCHSPGTGQPGDDCVGQQFPNPACTGTGGTPCTIADHCLAQ
jgi:hypothetical protein